MGFFWSHWVFEAGQESTIDFWWGDPPEYRGAQIAMPIPRFADGPFDVTAFGTKVVDFGSGRGVIYTVTIKNWASSAQAFDLAGGTLT